jgi:hypothetical protein
MEQTVTIPADATSVTFAIDADVSPFSNRVWAAFSWTTTPDSGVKLAESGAESTVNTFTQALSTIRGDVVGIVVSRTDTTPQPWGPQVTVSFDVDGDPQVFDPNPDLVQPGTAGFTFQF